MGTVTLRGLRKQYGAVEVIRGIDLEIGDGEFMVFVGPSGCGKSTTLRMIAGLEQVDGGEVLIDGRPAHHLHPAERGTAMVFQNYALYPHMTVAENMGFALKMAGVGRGERALKVGRAAETLRITDLLDRYPRQLSGGQRQRVAIGRAIVRQPRVFLFDEPLSNLDAALRVSMRIELMRLHRDLGTTMVYVTHDQVEAMTMGDRIAVFQAGTVAQVGAPLALYQRPANEFVAGFIGAPRINLIDRPTDAALGPHRALWSHIAGPAAAVGTRRIGLRPEYLQLLPAGQGVPARVELAEHLGDQSILHLRVEGLAELLIARVPAGSGPPDAGASVGLWAEAAGALAFGADQQRLGA
jgi:multiple sugar transport system ATP-binding protein